MLFSLTHFVSSWQVKKTKLYGKTRNFLEYKSVDFMKIINVRKIS